jgi:lipopolysaccharide export system ATP-binding protein
MYQKLHAKKIIKNYGPRPILLGIDIEVKRGEAVALLGPNGAGKTTCFSIMAGLIQPDHGEIYFDDHCITQLPLYKRARLGMGYLPQETSIFRGLNVEENILAILEYVETNVDVRYKRLDQLLDEFSISHVRKSSSLALSGGERRRLEIARSLASNPQFLLMDEPLAGIDPIATGEVRDLVKQLKNKGIGILITDHNVREALEIVDRAYVLSQGTILMQGTPEEIILNKEVRRVYLGERFMV